VQGLSRREAAEELGLPIGTVNSRIGRAREAAREAKKEVWARRRRERGE
jgi:DNA-directed RNA polymerase specialized sigma24 family protein